MTIIGYAPTLELERGDHHLRHSLWAQVVDGPLANIAVIRKDDLLATLRDFRITGPAATLLLARYQREAWITPKPGGLYYELAPLTNKEYLDRSIGCRWWEHPLETYLVVLAALYRMSRYRLSEREVVAQWASMKTAAGKLLNSGEKRMQLLGSLELQGYLEDRPGVGIVIFEDRLPSNFKRLTNLPTR